MVKKNDPWIEASDVIPMFPTLVWKVQVRTKLHEAIDAKILAALKRMRRDAPELAPGQGWQSNQTLHELEEFRDLLSCINNAAKSVLKFLRVGYDAFEITGCWANVLAKDAAHKAHSHPNNFLSGVYYLRTHPGTDTFMTQEIRPLSSGPRSLNSRPRIPTRSWSQ